jgi:serine/threonine protein kinase
MAPEIWGYVIRENSNVNIDTYTNAVDIWSFAYVVYNLLTQRLPFLILETLKDFTRTQLCFQTGHFQGLQ